MLKVVLVERLDETEAARVVVVSAEAVVAVVVAVVAVVVAVVAGMEPATNA